MIYDQIKILAKEKGVTIQQMERDLHLGAGSVCKWNQMSPRINTLKKVADYFGVTVDYIAGSNGKEGG